MSNKIQLTHGTLELLLGCLSQPSWTKRRGELVSAGDLLALHEPLVAARPFYTGEIALNGAPVSQTSYNEFRQTVRNWEDITVELNITDAGFQACVTCLRSLSDEAKLPSTRFTAHLLRTFKLTE
jgi:hypothetical protein